MAGIVGAIIERVSLDVFRESPRVATAVHGSCDIASCDEIIILLIEVHIIQLR
jgi:hypothetical protein